jgi:hypothetical protein
MANEDSPLDLSNGADDVLELDSQITSLSDEDFDKLMSGEDITEPPAPTKTPAAPSTKEVSPSKGAVKGSAPAKTDKAAETSSEMEEIDDTTKFFAQDPTPKKKPGKAAPPPDDDEEEKADKLPWPNEEEEEEEEDKDKDKEEELDEETARVMLTNTYNHLVKTGIWKEVEGEGFDPENISAEVYGQIAAQQASEAAHEAFDELMDRTGKYRVILDHSLRNGNPDEIINLFKEEHQINALDPAVPIDQKEMIRKYYKDILEWENDDIETFINKAEADKELEKYSGIARKKYQKHIDTAINTKNTELKAREEKASQDKQLFVDTMSGAIDDLKLPREKADMLKRSLFVPAFKVSPQKTITAFQAQMLNIQQNPEEYLDLIRFVMDKKAYLERASVKKQNTQAQEQFKIKLNGRSKIKSENPIQRQNNSKEQEDLQFFTPIK